jgi:hypothetical protein
VRASRYRQLCHANDQLAGQLREAHEVLYDLQATVQATPAHKRHEQQHLLMRMRGAEQVRAVAWWVARCRRSCGGGCVRRDVLALPLWLHTRVWRCVAATPAGDPAAGG